MFEHVNETRISYRDQHQTQPSRNKEKIQDETVLGAIYELQTSSVL